MLSISNLLEQDDLWIQDTDIKKGALHHQLGVPKDEKIPITLLQRVKLNLSKKAEKRKLSPSELKTSKRVNFAINAQGY